MKQKECQEILDKMSGYYKKQMRTQFWGFVSLFVAIIIVGLCALIFGSGG